MRLSRARFHRRSVARSAEPAVLGEVGFLHSAELLLSDENPGTDEVVRAGVVRLPSPFQLLPFTIQSQA